MLAAALCVACGASDNGSGVFTTSTSREGSLLVLENRWDKGTTRIGVDLAWGGSIVDVELDGANVVNRHDTGRDVHPAFYDGNARYDVCSGCSGVFGWDPVVGGDEYNRGSPVLDSRLAPDSLYVKSQPLEWNPDDKGGGPGKPILGDMLFEETVTPVEGNPHAFRVHYQVTHLGEDTHANIQQELPAVYVTAEHTRFLTYSGKKPWTLGAVDPTELPGYGAPGSILYTGEHWVAFVDERSEGLSVYAPSEYPYAIALRLPGPGGPAGNGASYVSPLAVLTIGPGFSLSTDIYLFVGDYWGARSTIYRLHGKEELSDVMPPIGSTQTPRRGERLVGVTPVTGWAFDDATLTAVDVYVDGERDGRASYGGPRPNLAVFYPRTPTDAGFDYALDTRRYADGKHTLSVRATDDSGNVAQLPEVDVTFSNLAIVPGLRSVQASAPHSRVRPSSTP